MQLVMLGGNSSTHTGEFTIPPNCSPISILCLLMRLVLWLQEQVSYWMYNSCMIPSERELESSRNGGGGGYQTYVYINCIYKKIWIWIYVHVYIIQYFSIATENLKPILLLPPSTEIDCNSRATGTSMSFPYNLSSFSRTWPELISPTLNLPDGVPHSGWAVANSILSLFLLRIIKANMNPLNFIYRWWAVRVFQHAI